MQTPLSPQREPDLSIVLGAVEDMAPRLQKGQLVVLESTTYPGTTRERLLPLLEESGLRVGEDFHLAFSPERVDPGREDWTTKNTPKIVGGITPACTERAVELYSRALETVHRSLAGGRRVDEAAREHLPLGQHRARERACAVCDQMRIDVWEVIGAAATKPFGFMSFQPGPGSAATGMPIDPFYLTWKGPRGDDFTEFIELAGKVEREHAHWCLARSRALNHQRRLSRAEVLLLGVAYKSDIEDTRESPVRADRVLQERARTSPTTTRSYRAAGACAPLRRPSTQRPPTVAIVTAHSDRRRARPAGAPRRRPAERDGSNGTSNGKVWKL